MCKTFDFEGFRVSPQERLLTRAGSPLAVPPKAFDLLLLFLEHPNELLHRADLLESLWRDVSVEEGNLSKCVFFLREVLGHNLIQTVSKQGYRFCASVTRQEADSNRGGPIITKLSQASKAAACAALSAGLDTKDHTDSDENFSVAVLPFENFSSDHSEDYFGDGLAEEVIHAVAQLPGFRVPARTSSFRFRGAQDVSVVARELKVDTVLEGSVRRVGSRVRVTAQLVDAKNGFHLWSEHYDRDFIEIFSIQDDISRAIANKLKCDSETGRLQVPTRQHTENLAAYAAYLEGRFHWFQLSLEGIGRSKTCFEKAIALDPTYALAHLGLADYYYTIASMSLVPLRAVVPLAFAAVTRALEIKRDLAEAHATIAVHYAFQYDWSRSEKEFKRALHLNPAYPLAHYFYAMWFLRPLGKLDAALAELEKALVLDPLSPLFHFAQGYVHYHARQPGRANNACQQIERLAPAWPLIHLLTALIHLHEGNYQNVVTAAEALQQAYGQSYTTALGLRATAYARAGKLAEAERVLDKVTSLALPSGAIGAMVWAATALNDNDRAFKWLADAVEGQDVFVTGIVSDPLFDALRCDPRFQDVLRRMRLF